MYYISHILLCMCFLLFIIKNTARCWCMWKWNFRTNFTQSVGHSVTFHIHSCMNSYYIAYYCKELDYFPPLLNGVNVVGCGSASLPTWITHSLGKGIRLRLHWQCALQVFGVTRITWMAGVLRPLPILRYSSGYLSTQWHAEAALSMSSEMKRLRSGTRLIPNSKSRINLAVAGY